MKKWSSKLESTWKTEQDKPFRKILTSINGGDQSQQVLTAIGLTWQCGSEWCVGTWSTWGAWERVRHVRAREIRRCRVKACGCVLWQAKTWGGTWRCVGAPLGLFLARFWSKNSDLSHRNCGSTIWLMNRLDPRGNGWVWRQWLASNDGYRWRRG